MKKLIACCGLNCEECDARVATLNNDDKLRRKTAKQWSKQFGEKISVEAINCTGCREEGVRIGHCAECHVHNCVQLKGYTTCADCPELEICQLVAQIHQYSEEAFNNLKSLIN